MNLLFTEEELREIFRPPTNVTRRLPSKPPLYTRHNDATRQTDSRRPAVMPTIRKPTRPTKPPTSGRKGLSTAARMQTPSNAANERTDKPTIIRRRPSKLS
ncbi:hypothetical protein GE061_002652, partial [Apolygus lucorum]